MAEMKTCFLELWSWFLNSFYDWITKLTKVEFHFWLGAKVVHTLVWLECQIWNSNSKWYLKDVYEIRKWAQKFILCAKSRTTDAQWGNGLYSTAKNPLPLPNFCLPYQPKFSDFFDLCLQWVSIVCAFSHLNKFLQKTI